MANINYIGAPTITGDMTEANEAGRAARAAGNKADIISKSINLAGKVAVTVAKEIKDNYYENQKEEEINIAKIEKDAQDKKDNIDKFESSTEAKETLAKFDKNNNKLDKKQQVSNYAAEQTKLYKEGKISEASYNAKMNEIKAQENRIIKEAQDEKDKNAGIITKTVLSNEIKGGNFNVSNLDKERKIYINSGGSNGKFKNVVLESIGDSYKSNIANTTNLEELKTVISKNNNTMSELEQSPYFTGREYDQLKKTNAIEINKTIKEQEQKFIENGKIEIAKNKMDDNRLSPESDVMKDYYKTAYPDKSKRIIAIKNDTKLYEDADDKRYIKNTGFETNLTKGEKEIYDKHPKVSAEVLNNQMMNSLEIAKRTGDYSEFIELGTNGSQYVKQGFGETLKTALNTATDKKQLDELVLELDNINKAGGGSMLLNATSATYVGEVIAMKTLSDFYPDKSISELKQMNSNSKINSGVYPNGMIDQQSVNKYGKSLGSDFGTYQKLSKMFLNNNPITAKENSKKLAKFLSENNKKVTIDDKDINLNTTNSNNYLKDKFTGDYDESVKSLVNNFNKEYDNVKEISIQNNGKVFIETEDGITHYENLDESIEEINIDRIKSGKDQQGLGKSILDDMNSNTAIIMKAANNGYDKINPYTDTYNYFLPYLKGDKNIGDFGSDAKNVAKSINDKKSDIVKGTVNLFKDADKAVENDINKTGEVLYDSVGNIINNITSTNSYDEAKLRFENYKNNLRVKEEEIDVKKVVEEIDDSDKPLYIKDTQTNSVFRKQQNIQNNNKIYDKVSTERFLSTTIKDEGYYGENNTNGVIINVPANTSGNTFLGFDLGTVGHEDTYLGLLETFKDEPEKLEELYKLGPVLGKLGQDAKDSYKDTNFDESKFKDKKTTELINKNMIKFAKGKEKNLRNVIGNETVNKLSAKTLGSINNLMFNGFSRSRMKDFKKMINSNDIKKNIVEFSKGFDNKGSHRLKREKRVVNDFIDSKLGYHTLDKMPSKLIVCFLDMTDEEILDMKEFDKARFNSIWSNDFYDYKITKKNIFRAKEKYLKLLDKRHGDNAYTKVKYAK